ncbi:NADH-quinone oxidoreductase subunit L [Candidatus Anaplasma sp. TIGMIC]|uniref:NADH-quinone oxidoreductase subunit L n=1 Tax=Candidatus Anaplasma sp. TIGMIC TaxID=3020713 RepID=UPI00232B1D20|nr:NADH-quinone oxidoreductase subunit L [Candidatus Anaplasma sp. TIGMIC]MDB1135156.1 NADH-quinone oxidoreductase subunit L [Candidatus Anaplasma sp. TIGMIC]
MFCVEFLCVVLPLFGAALGYLFRHNRIISHVLACCFIGQSAVLSWYIFFTATHGYSVDIAPWFDVGGVSVNWSIYVDRLTTVMMIVVTTVSFIVHLYSVGYMDHDKGAARFLSYLSLFTFFMMALITSGNFMQLFFGWEGVGLCSYLLIGFWFHRDSATKAALKAFIVNRVGDLFFLCGILVVFYAFHSLSFDEIFAKISDGMDAGIIQVLGFRIHAVDLACILLFLGCMGKSAQLGLHVWLPDAMEGPTPASALIHAATMVTAGVFLVARNSFMLELSPIAREVILMVGLMTCLFAACVAVVQDDIKKIVAYSTCSQLGYMFVACGTSNYHLAIFHLLTHAFFKSLLFLLAGNVIHANHGEQRIECMSNNCWRDIPFTYVLMWIGSLALMGVFPFAGYYSKDLIIESSYGNTVGFVITNLVACLTSVYSCRLMMRVFHNSDTDRISSIHEAGKIMLLPLLVLAVGAVFSGMVFKNFVGITGEKFWLHSIDVHEHHIVISKVMELMPMFMGVAGMVSYYLYHSGKLRNFAPSMFVHVLKNKFYFDEVYVAVFVVPMQRVSGLVWRFADQKVIDYFILGGITGAVGTCAKHSVKVQNGRVVWYTLVMLLGVVTAALIVVYGFKTR